MTIDIEYFVDDLMKSALINDREGGLFPLLRTNWSNLDTGVDAYFSIKNGFDSIFLTLKIDSDYRKEVGELGLLGEKGKINLRGNEEEETILIITYPTSSREYYLSFVLECCSELAPDNSIEDMEKILYKWIKRWKLKGSSSREKRIGLFGELLFLEYLLTTIEGIDWRCWQERIEESGLHDFIVNETLFEIKTSTSQNALIHVFDSTQFEHDPRLKLILMKIVNDKANGRSLNFLIGEIRSLIPEDQHNLFDNIMRTLGSPFPELDNEKFIFNNLKWYLSKTDGPFLQRSDLIENSRIGLNINYSIFESDIPFNGSGELDLICELMN